MTQTPTNDSRPSSPLAGLAEDERTRAPATRVKIERQSLIEREMMPAVSDIDHETETLQPQLRPLTFADYPGQARVKDNLAVYVSAAKQRSQAMDHAILHGPPGLGKTTLAAIMANELGVAFYATSGPSIDKPGDLAGILAGLEPRAVLFIDEIHRLSIQVEEVLYSAMEDFSIDMIVGQGQSARSMRMPIAPFTLIGATTRLSLLSRPLISRFGIQEHLDFYDAASLAIIIERSARILEVPLTADGATMLAKRARGTPRLANRLLRRVRDFALVDGVTSIDGPAVARALQRLEIDQRGLDGLDRLILETIASRYDGGPVGLETLAATIGEEAATLEDVYEPFLVHQGLLARSPRGRVLTPAAQTYLAETKSQAQSGAT